MKMNKLIGLLLIVLLAISCKSNNEIKGTFVFNPEKPKVGEEITIKYNPVNTDLGSVQAVDAVVYSYSTDIEEAKEIYLSKKGGLWTGKFTTTSEARGLFIIFKNDETIDNNNEQGYNIKLYNNDGIIPGATAGLAILHQRYSRLIGFKGDAEFAKLMLEEEFQINPNVKAEYLETYFFTLQKSKRDSVIRVELEALEATEDLSENNLELFAKFFPMTGDIVKGTKYLEMLTENFPESEYVQQAVYGKFREEKSIENQIDILNQTIEKYPNGKSPKWMFSYIMSGLAKSSKFDKAESLIEQYPKLVTSNVYNSVAWQMFETKNNISKAVVLAEKGVEVAKKANEEKPKYYTEKQWAESKQMSLGAMLDTYANLLKATNQKEKALSVFEEAVNVTNEEHPDINEGYTSMLVELGKNEKAKDVLQKLLDSGKSTDKMKSLYSQVFVGLGGSDADLNKYLSKNNEDANQKIIEKLKEEIINKPAPQFTLIDVDGKSVSLADFKGKTVVVDFWATWCSPCVKSFPAMQKAQAKLTKNNDVKFLFINTWERVEDKKKNVVDFLKKTNYPFHVLMDENNDVVSEFGVEGIPTKFIVDKNGSIRFKSVGFKGADELVVELEQMISMVK
ncbi:MAG: redoxin family protein [Ignavibacteriae bacterium]|nr:redoxin family protein [Ignavibacteriota bacterium]